MEKFEIIKKADPIGTFDIKLPNSIKTLSYSRGIFLLHYN